MRLVVCLAGVLVAVTASLLAVGGSGAAPARVAAKSAVPKVTVVTVTAGKPSELGFKLSKTSKLAAGTITFKVTNQGVAYHDFKLCKAPVASPSNAKNACVGKATPILKHGQSATLTVKISKTGLYEFLCSVAGHAAGGMKGILGIGVPVTAGQQSLAAHTATTPAPTTTTATTTPAGGATTTTTTRPGSGGGGGNASGCAPGVTIQTAGNTDADGDELGTEVDDNDGCV